MSDQPGSAPPHPGGNDAFFAALIEDDPEELYERAPCAYLSCRLDGTIVKVNETLLAWTGYERHALVQARRFQDLLPAGDRIYYETHFAPLLRMQGRVREMALEVVCEGGTRLPVLVNSVIKYDASGEPALMRTVLFDATERRSYELELLAARERAERSEARSQSLARTLQASLLPPVVIQMTGVEVGGAYRPAGDGTEVGGDFYDVFETGRDVGAVVLGDVSGKGAEAAIVTALARHTVRAEALHSGSPSAILSMLHQAILTYHPDRFCTAALLILEVAAGGLRGSVSVGGHYLPLVRRADGSFGEIGVPGSILGMIDEPDLTDVELALGPGDALVLYTDGVVEARQGLEFFGSERLCEIVGNATGVHAQEMADGIVAAALEYQGGFARDDIAVVVVQVPG